MSNIVITGANRGIGLEFVRSYASPGNQVIAACRKPKAAEDLDSLTMDGSDAVRLAELDVTDPDSIEAFASSLGNDPVDLLINNAGTSGPADQGLEAADWDGWLRTFETNVLGHFFVTQALLSNLRSAAGATVVMITSRVGSIELSSGGRYAYRTTKAAANMLARSLAADLKADDITCIAMHPGWVRTRMGGDAAPLTPAESVGKMAAVIRKLDRNDAGSFLDLDGNVLPW